MSEKLASSVCAKPYSNTIKERIASSCCGGRHIIKEMMLEQTRKERCVSVSISVSVSVYKSFDDLVQSSFIFISRKVTKKSKKESRREKEWVNNNVGGRCL